ncbi:MAG: type II toxin-antitoxin system RelE/ParE family toxin [Bacillota bacterium]
MYDIVFYEDEAGNKPVEDYLLELMVEAEKSKHGRIQYHKVVHFTKLLQQFGTRAGEEITKHLGGGLWELRPLDNRILFFGWIENKFVMLHHFKKRTKKTPQGEIDTAERRRADWLERKGGK